ncbi:MAG: hypothetical protein L6Q99_16025 [Planctomycetes bacterium]|nr:hypothetical protein [Planctomycetota bacterium]
MTMLRPAVSDVAFVMASPKLHPTGLLGWARFTLDGRYCLDGIAVRKTLSGRLTLSFPERVDRHGRSYAVVRPLDDATRIAIETQVFDALACDGRLSA